MTNSLDELERLARLRDQGHLTEAEFEAQKAVLRRRESGRAPVPSAARRSPTILVVSLITLFAAIGVAAAGFRDHVQQPGTAPNPAVGALPVSVTPAQAAQENGRQAREEPETDKCVTDCDPVADAAWEKRVRTLMENSEVPMTREEAEHMAMMDIEAEERNGPEDDAKYDKLVEHIQDGNGNPVASAPITANNPVLPYDRPSKGPDGKWHGPGWANCDPDSTTC